eukprot:GHUV01045033.1.p1 GENE.GHUV01045033.1~~GHUV01045033.1.p1  ORF type:complete len:205 (-),score=34.40 GHUV01045033.1:257-871(-)
MSRSDQSSMDARPVCLGCRQCKPKFLYGAVGMQLGWSVSLEPSAWGRAVSCSTVVDTSHLRRGLCSSVMGMCCCMQGTGLSWLFPFENGQPPIGWKDAVAYLVLPALLIVSQYVSQKIISPKTDDPQQKQTQAILQFIPLMIGKQNHTTACQLQHECEGVVVQSGFVGSCSIVTSRPVGACGGWNNTWCALQAPLTCCCCMAAF